jgi:hypothetical protein
MKPTPILIAATGMLVLGAVGVAAQQHEPMSMPVDGRQQLDFPEPMRKHMLMNMRSHFEALGEVLTALGDGDGAKASTIARERLGLESQAAAACAKPGAKTTGTEEDHMTHMASMMAQVMPEQMRAMGYAMHESASDFAGEAARMQPGGDPKPALKALAKVTENCAACHAAYRLR